MRSPVGWALLGLLIDRPDYGYNLFHRFQRAYGDTLELSTPSQIYAGLNGLETNGLIERLPSEDASPDAQRQSKAERQPKPRYGATQQGEKAYRERLIAQACDTQKHTRLFILQLAASDPDTALAVLDAYEQYHLKGSPAAPAQGSPAASDFAKRLIDVRERLALDGTLSWIQYVRGEFEARAGTQQQSADSLEQRTAR
jgi:DNA-binding PadR family transcriptional regulator